MESKPVFICDIKGCEKIFTTKYSLLRHTLTHNKKKPYQCKECNKTFSIRQNLIEHEFVHSGELPYVWNFDGCTERFRQRGKLSLHRQTHKNYQKKSYRSHVSINEGETRPREHLAQPGEVVNNIHQHVAMIQNWVTPTVSASAPKVYFLNNACGKLNQFTCANANVIRFSTNMANGGYQVIRTSLAPINIVSRPGPQVLPNNGILPKLSVVLMPNNQLGCKFN